MLKGFFLHKQKSAEAEGFDERLVMSKTTQLAGQEKWLFHL